MLVGPLTISKGNKIVKCDKKAALSLTWAHLSKEKSCVCIPTYQEITTTWKNKNTKTNENKKNIKIREENNTNKN